MQTPPQFSTNCTTRNQVRYKKGTVVEDISSIPCIFCGFTTCIEFDLDLHLYEAHRMELVKLPIGKGNMDYRIEYAIEDGKRIRNVLSGLTQKAQDKLGIRMNSNKDISSLPSEIQIKSGLDFILDHLDEPLFPRKIMTKELARQIQVFDRRSMLLQFKMSNYYDCRVNAYSCQEDESLLNYSDEIRLPVTIIVIDLDLKDFDNSKEKLDGGLQESLNKIQETIGGCPTVLNTGNGYHVYQPISGIILDEIGELAEYFNFNKYYLPNKFLKFAEQYFTDSRCDLQHNPTINSSLLRIPETINSKCKKAVSVLQEWDYHKSSIEPLIPDFKKYLSSQQEIIDRCANRYKIMHRSKQNRDVWIDILLEIPLGDYRNFVVRRILAPYLMVVKQLLYEDCVSCVEDWLGKCNEIERLRFNPKSVIHRSFRSVQRIGYRPIRLETLQKENPVLYNIVIRRLQNKTKITDDMMEQDYRLKGVASDG